MIDPKGGTVGGSTPREMGQNGTENTTLRQCQQTTRLVGQGLP